MEAVYGVAKAGRAHEAFVAEVRSRMRRCCAITTSPTPSSRPLAASRMGPSRSPNATCSTTSPRSPRARDSGCHFDFYSVDFWVDNDGDLKRFDPLRFPHGFQNIARHWPDWKLPPALWIDSSCALVDRRQPSGAADDELAARPFLALSRQAPAAAPVGR